VCALPRRWSQPLARRGSKAGTASLK
jgi:hypothetical protein